MKKTRTILTTSLAMLALTGSAFAYPLGTYPNVSDWKTGPNSYKVMKGNCVFSVDVNGVYTYQCQLLTSNDGTCKARIYPVVLNPSTPPNQVVVQLEPYSGSHCPNGGSPNDLLTDVNPNNWYWTPAIGGSGPEIDFVVTDSTGSSTILDPDRNTFGHNP